MNLQRDNVVCGSFSQIANNESNEVNDSSLSTILLCSPLGVNVSQNPRMPRRLPSLNLTTKWRSTLCLYVYICIIFSSLRAQATENAKRLNKCMYMEELLFLRRIEKTDSNPFLCQKRPLPGCSSCRIRLYILVPFLPL